MIPRPVLVVLVFGLAVLIVTFSVLMAFYALVSGLGDASAAHVLLWIGVTCLILTAVDSVLLIGCLGVNAVARGDERQDER